MDFGGLHTDFGNSSRMTEVHAVLGLIQLTKLSKMIAKRQRCYDIITKHLQEANINFVSTEHMDSASQYKLIVLLPKDKNVEEIKKSLFNEKVLLGGEVYQIPCHLQPVFKNINGGQENLPIAEYWCPRHICPPLTSGMTDEEADITGKMLVKYLTAS